ncbi:hypothetical protein JST97_14035 [bacterium]|nr:hypothetical protein [bacterium]
MRIFTLSDLCKNWLGWVFLLLSLRLVAWVDPEPVILQFYDSIFCLAMLSGLWASSQPRLRKNRP